MFLLQCLHKFSRGTRFCDVTHPSFRFRNLALNVTNITPAPAGNSRIYYRGEYKKYEVFARG